jgi:NAD-dependent dihydropyrimidine dehydrogenase PreA subunit
MALFIRVSLDREACEAFDGCRTLIGTCPVDIFREEQGQVVVDDAQVDECTLCGLCLEATPGAVDIEKLY